MCLWMDSNYLTDGFSVLNFEFQYYHTDFAFVDWWESGTAVSVDNTTSSVYNNGNSYNAALFANPREGGYHKTFVKKTGQSQLTGYWNDRASSGYFCSYTSAC